MRVTRNMLNEDLRRFYFPANIIALVLSKPWLVRLMHKFEGQLSGQSIDGLRCEEAYIPSRNGDHQIRIRIFKPLKESVGMPGFLYLHGGGYMIGNPESYLDVIQKFIDKNPCVIVAPDYRKALDDPFPAAFDDCYDCLLWMKENVNKLGITNQQFIVGGHSAGGGLTAAIALKARDSQEVEIAFQMPIYPMIDDKQITESARDCDSPAWNSKSNQLGWGEYLKDLKDKAVDIPQYAAPARASDFTNLPPTITFVGQLEPFRDETIKYVERLREDGVPVRFKLFEGCFHGFDIIAMDSGVGKAAWTYVLDSFSEYIKAYF